MNYRYLVNACTFANAFLGLSAFWLLLNGYAPFYAFIAIVIASAFDYLDGFLATKLNVSTKIGKQLDSLADVISYGAAPALALMFQNNIFTTITSFIWLACVIYRLGRFNVSKTTSYFEGLPSTAAGISFFLVVTFVNNILILSTISIILALLMVSKIKVVKIKLS